MNLATQKLKPNEKYYLISVHSVRYLLDYFFLMEGLQKISQRGN